MDKEDYQFFLASVGDLIVSCHLKCYAWVLMPNHFHLLLETGRTPLAKFMSRLSTRYAGYFNRKYRRSGKLFQNRYKAILCDKDNYFKELVAYIHLNPLRARMVKDLDGLARFPWSGHRALIGTAKIPWQTTHEVLESFGRNIKEAQSNYRAYLAELQGVRKDLSGGGLIRSAGGLYSLLSQKATERALSDTRILGDGQFTENALRHCERIDEQKVQFKKRYDFKKFLEEIAGKKSVPIEEITKPGKTTTRGSECRSLIIYLAHRFFDEEINSIAERISIRQPSASILYQKGEQQALKQRDWIQKDLKITI